MKLFSNSGGYRRLDSYTLATIIQLATWRFCEKYLNLRNDPCGRQFAQMTQAARSGRENIIEGSERSATSKETEIKLTDVAKASLSELRGDYEMWILKQRKLPWRKDSPEARAVFSTRLDKPEFKDDWVYESAVYLFEQEKKFAQWLESDDNVVIANTMMILIRRTLNMLINQLEAQGEMSIEEGGFRERMTAARLEARDAQTAANAPECPECGKPMRKRMAKGGSHAGKEFWGCTGYPECRGIREIEG